MVMFWALFKVMLPPTPAMFLAADSSFRVWGRSRREMTVMSAPVSTIPDMKTGWSPWLNSQFMVGLLDPSTSAQRTWGSLPDVRQSIGMVNPCASLAPFGRNRGTL